MLKGAIDHLHARKISGWVQGDANGGPIAVSVVLDRRKLLTTLDGAPAEDEGEGPVLRFTIALPRDATLTEICTPEFHPVAEQGKDVHTLSIWGALRLGARLEAEPPVQLATAIGFLPATTQFALRGDRSVEGIWTRLDQRRPACVITYANGDGGWFRYFYDHYGAALGGSTAIYVVTPRPDEFADYDLGGVISVAGVPYDNSARAELMSGLASGLQAAFRWTIVCDVDEIIIPFPGSGLTFLETLAALPGPNAISRGYEILQGPDDAAFDLTLPVLAQRHLAIGATEYSKPHFASQPVRYWGGYHFCTFKPRFAPEGQGFLTLHLKWACRRMRAEVAALVRRTEYQGEVAEKALRGVTTKVHPALREGPLPIVDFAGEARADFERRFEESARYWAVKDLWMDGYFLSDMLFDLSCLAPDTRDISASAA